MHSDRLTRKTHFRRLKDRGETGAGISLLPADDQSAYESWAFSDLLADAMHCEAQDIDENPVFDDEYDALVWCMRLIMESPTALALARDADFEGWAVCFADLKNEGFIIDSQDRLITLDHFSMAPNALGRSAYFRHIMLTTFIRALRDVWHDSRMDEDDVQYTPEDTLMLERVRAADGDATTILCGWELRGAGFSEVWRHLLGSEEGDMAIIFTRFLDRDPGSLFNGAALAYAFRQWYADASRVDGVDHETLESLDVMMQESDDALNPFGTARVDAAKLESITLLPDGVCYLAGLGQAVLKDPFFAGLNDPNNQTHLFHMIYDTEVTMVNNVPFRDARLARLIFPAADIVKVRS